MTPGLPGVLYFMAVITKKIRVSGHVQMVGYRWFAKEKADICHIKGYVRNTSRGDVDILAQGSEEDMASYLDYLKLGPSRARVGKITSYEEKDDKLYNEFNIRM